jgi:hypothetical protein
LRPVIVNNEFYTQGALNEPRRSFSWFYRTPIKEFDNIYRMRSAMMMGQFDHNKEILFPRSKNGEPGYDVITPFYYYDKFVLDNDNTYIDDKGREVKAEVPERGALAVNRGW